MPIKIAGNFFRNLSSCLCVLATLTPTAGLTQSSQQFLILPEARYLSQHPNAAGRNDDDYHASLDLLYALDAGPYRFFAEFIATDDNSELARLHLGYQLRGGTTFQLGRFQTNQGFWNKTFHFRNYIQPSILAPAIANYEDEDGALPAHFAGVNARHRWALANDSALILEAGFGTGVKFDRTKLKPWDLLDPDGGRKPTTSVRLSYRPDDYGDTEFGAFYVDNRVLMNHTLFLQNDQRVTGGYADTRFGSLRLYGTLYSVENELKGVTSARQHDNFYSAWLQGDYSINPNWMPYVRFEHSNGGRSDPYVSLFPAFVRDRQLVGLRWDFLDNQALKAEYARTDFLHEESDQWALQWSLIFP